MSFDLSPYRELYTSESLEQLQRIQDGLLALERDPQDRPTLDAVFRAAHTLKGMAATMGYSDLARLAHAMEDLLDTVRQGARLFTPDLATALLHTLDGFRSLLASAVNDQPPTWSAKALLEQIQALVLAAPDQAMPLSPSGPRSTIPEPIQETMRVNVHHLDALMTLADRLAASRDRLLRLCERKDIVGAEQGIHAHAHLISELQEMMLRVRLTPVGQVFSRFPRMVRDLALEQGKEVAVVLEGTGTELDRSILEEIGEPLMHLVRNAVVHGIEVPEERVRAGKPTQGTVQLTARRDREGVVVEVSDDGRGIDPEEMRRAAWKRGLMTRELAEALSPEEALMLVTLPGLTTATVVSSASGRGVGLDAVQSKIESLRGRFAIRSQMGAGTTISFQLASSLALVDALIVRARGQTVALALAQIERIVPVDPPGPPYPDLCTLTVGEEEVLCAPLGCLLDPNGSTDTEHIGYLLLTHRGGRAVGLLVEALTGKEQIVVKPLHGWLAAWPGLSGGTLRADGEVVFLLDVPHLLDETIDKFRAR